MTARDAGRIAALAAITADLVHRSRVQNLTLSEVPARPAEPRPPAVHRDNPQDITPEPGTADRLALAIGRHLSPRAAGAIRDWDGLDAEATRAAFVRQAIAAAIRCPMCRHDLGADRG
jgi:hypothetical protein